MEEVSSQRSSLCTNSQSDRRMFWSKRSSVVLGVSHGKAKTDKLTHTCSGCGDVSLFCCSKSQDAKSTQGMEKH